MSVRLKVIGTIERFCLDCGAKKMFEQFERPDGTIHKKLQCRCCGGTRWSQIKMDDDLRRIKDCEAEEQYAKERYFVSLGMKTYGGSFVNSLGESLSHADGINSYKIYETFPEYWKQYLKCGEELYKKEQDEN